VSTDAYNKKLTKTKIERPTAIKIRGEGIKRLLGIIFGKGRKSASESWMTRVLAKL
jgi:hypothetical protein